MSQGEEERGEETGEKSNVQITISFLPLLGKYIIEGKANVVVEVVNIVLFSVSA